MLRLTDSMQMPHSVEKEVFVMDVSGMVVLGGCLHS